MAVQSHQDGRSGQTVQGVDRDQQHGLEQPAMHGKKAIAISGREIKATIQLRNKQLAEIVSKQAKKVRRSRRNKRLQRAKYRVLKHAKNKVRDLCHKATRKVADAFPNAKAYVGESFNDACQKMGRKQAQTVSTACNRKIVSLLNYRLAACIEADTRHLAMSWVARISAPSESRAGCDRVVAYPTQSNLRILQSILAHRQVVPGTPGKLLGSNSEKLQGFSPRRVSRLDRGDRLEQWPF
jgi:hypothetical protein